MITVLIIEDKPDKAKALTDAVTASGVTIENIHVVPDLMAAKTSIKQSIFNILIVDLRIPLRFGEKTKASGGPELLRWLGRRDAPEPEAVLAVTGFELDVETALILDDMGVPQVRYRPGDDKWQRVVTGVIKRVLRRHCQNGQTEHREQVDFLVQTTVDIEFKSIQRVFSVEGPGILSQGETWHKVVVTRDEESRTVVLVQANQMGMPAAAALASKAINRWNPKMMFLAGICAGVKDEVALGDILVPDPSWDYGSGKLTSDGILYPDPRPVELREAMRSTIKFHATSAPLRDWWEEWPASKPPNVPRIICTPAASGAAVLADDKTVKDILSHSRKLAGVEMEAYGFYYAVSNAGIEPSPGFASFKSVVDFADREKTDDYQAYGAYISAKFIRWLIDQSWSIN